MFEASGDSNVKIKDIVSEQGFWSSFGKSLLPNAMKKAIDAKKPMAPPTDLDLAKLAYEKFGDNPESEFPGTIGWLNPRQQAALVNAKEKELRKKEFQQRQTAQQQSKNKEIRGMQKLAKDVLDKSTSQSSAPSRATKQTAPAQVKLPTGEFITKYGSDWYDEQGQKIVIPGDVERLERMSKGPTGQAQMSATKNIPVAPAPSKGKQR